jgi:uncharacterized protein (TIGR02598 family)
MTSEPYLLRSIKAFSLVEVTIALGLVSFSMLAIVGLLPVGLKTFRDSRVETTLGGIQRQMRGEVEAVPFAMLTNGSFTAGKYYFSDEGTLLPGSSQAYYEVSTELANTSAPGLAATADTSIRTLKVSVVSPFGLPATAQKTNSFSIVVANQTGEKASTN